MSMFNPAHPGELVKEATAWIVEVTGKKLGIEDVANGLVTTRNTLLYPARS